MGAGKQYSLHEIDDTRAAGRDHAFEDILTRVVDAGGDITEDEQYPLYLDFGMEEAEVGTERTVEFNLNRFDFKLVRRVETHRVTGEGKNKSLEPMSPQRVNISMKRKKDTEDVWQVVDLEEMF
jgi:hypothetical protein